MSEFYDFEPPRHNRRRTPLLAVVLVGVFSALFGALAGAYIGPAFIYGRFLPYPQALNNAQYTLPTLTGDNASYDLIAAGAVAQVAERVGPTVVGIVNRSRVSSVFGSYQQQSTGSGIIFDASGLIVTNQHVISNAVEIVVVFADNIQVKAQLIGADERTDLAVLRINPAELPASHRNLPVAEFGDSSRLKVGELAVAIGNPLGLQFQRTVTAGIISAVERTLTMDDVTYKVVQTDAAINSGNSGGALSNARGQIIGINQAKINISGVEGMGFAIPVNVARPIIEDLVRHGRVIRPWLGVRGVALTPTLAAQYSVSVTQGVYIDVVENSPASKAGLRRGDVIIKYDGITLNDFEQMRDLIAKTGVNGTATLEIRRGNSTLTIKIKLEAAP